MIQIVNGGSFFNRKGVSNSESVLIWAKMRRFFGFFAEIKTHVNQRSRRFFTTGSLQSPFFVMELTILYEVLRWGPPYDCERIPKLAQISPNFAEILQAREVALFL